MTMKGLLPHQKNMMECEPVLEFESSAGKAISKKGRSSNVTPTLKPSCGKITSPHFRASEEAIVELMFQDGPFKGVLPNQVRYSDWSYVNSIIDALSSKPEFGGIFDSLKRMKDEVALSL